MSFTEEDKIGRQDIVDKISSLVDNLQEDEHFCLALNGEWGSGKSYVMDMLREKFAEHEEYIVVNYDAWKNNFYSDPLIAILYCILDSIKKYAEVSQEIKEKVKSGLIKTLKSWGNETLSAMKKVGGITSAIACAIEGISNVITASGKLANHNKLQDFRSYQTLIEEVKSQLNKLITTEIFNGKRSKLIIMVDEIDRCLPDEQLKILERLHHLFEVKNCVTIIAMNQFSVAKTVNTIYGIDGYEYLRKFFDFTFMLDISASAYLKNLFEGFIKSFEKLKFPNNEMAYPIKLAFQCLLYGENKVLEKVDNRELTRYYECVTNICNDFDLQKLNQQYVFFILIGLYIRKIISPTFLNVAEIVQNQQNLEGQHKNIPANDLMDIMPYYDYLNLFLGLDRDNPPSEFKRLYGWNGSHIEEFSWAFNEIVFYSMGKDFKYNAMRRFYKQPIVNPEDCKELRRLILLYGGEQGNVPDEK